MFNGDGSIAIIFSRRRK